MAEGTRTLKLSILADVDNLNKNLKKAATDVDDFGDKLTKFGNVALKAFTVAAAAAAAYAVKIGVDGVKAAMEDEKSQRILAATLENTTNATNDQIAAVEDYITKTALATGVTDDQLRPAMSRLVRSTKDVEEAQKLLNLSLDISSATGKPLELVANSLGKAYDGNTAALGKLGLGIDSSILKSGDFNKVFNELRSSFAGFAAQEANTLQGRLDRMKVAFDEIKETIGYALLPIFEKLVAFIVNSVVPAFAAFVNGLTGNDKAVDSLNDTEKSAYNVGASFRDIAKSIGQLAAAFSTDGKSSLNGFITLLNAVAQTATVVVTVIKELISFIVEMANQVISFLNLFGAGIQKINSIKGTAFSAWGGTGASSGLVGGGVAMGRAGGAGGLSTSGAGGGAGGAGGVSGGSGSGSGAGTGGGGGTGASAGGTGATSLNNLVERLTGIQDKFTELTFLVETGGISKKAGIAQLDQLTKEFNVLQNQANTLGASAGFQAKSPTINNYTVNVSGALDSESTARQIVEVLNDSAARGTLGALSLSGVKL